jgi:hypothetical protein
MFLMGHKSWIWAPKFIRRSSNRNSRSSDTFCSVSGMKYVTEPLITQWFRKPQRFKNISASSLMTVGDNQWHQHDKSICLASAYPDSPSFPADKRALCHLAGKPIVRWDHRRWFLVAENSRAHVSKSCDIGSTSYAQTISSMRIIFMPFVYLSSARRILIAQGALSALQLGWWPCCLKPKKTRTVFSEPVTSEVFVDVTWAPL